ncbi:uncharacterized protein LOC142802882 [Rhipicephalus microplus]|uniref:uncharacterized protein LOC142802882 n=1 Tax=Rhipicephalus microplus TaxID=6941 RepID=UPI003F6B40F9
MTSNNHKGKLDKLGAYLYGAFLPLSWWLVGTLPKALAGFVPVVLLPLLRLEADDNFVARYYSHDVLTATALFLLAVRTKSQLSDLLKRMSLNVGLSFGLHVRWLFFSVSLLAFLVGLVLSEGPASVLFACLVDTMIRIWYDDTIRMFSLQSGAFGIRRVSETHGSLSGSEPPPTEQQTTSESSRYHTGSEGRPEPIETVALALHKGAAAATTEGPSDSTAAGPTRRRF